MTTAERWDAEDIVAGTPHCGPDGIVGRVQDAIAEAHNAGIEAGHDESFDEGVDSTLGDMSAALSKELGIEVELGIATVDSIIEAMQKDRVEQFNQGVDTLAEKLDTKRAAKVAETVCKTDD